MFVIIITIIIKNWSCKAGERERKPYLELLLKDEDDGDGGLANQCYFLKRCWIQTWHLPFIINSTRCRDLPLMAMTCATYPKKRGLPLSMVVAPTIDKMVQPMCSHLCWRRAGAVAPLLPIKKHRERESKEKRVVRMWREERKRGCHCSSCKCSKRA